MTNKLPSSRFRRQLKDQLPILESEGLVTPQQTQALSNRYQLNTLGSEAMSMLLTVIYTIGAVLIGIGIISFVAAHWDNIDRSTKIIMIFAVMFVAHGTGFYLWQIRGSYPKLGHTLVLLGTLIFGANIGLMAQIFHIHSNPSNGFMAWSLGAIIAAYALRSIPNAVLAAIVAIIALFASTTSYPHYIPAWFPLAAIILFVPFIYYTKSCWALCSTLVLLILSFPFTFTREGCGEFGSVAGLALAGVLLFAWGTISYPKPFLKFIAPGAWTFGIIAAFFALYLCSFFDFCRELVPHWENSFLASFSAFFITSAVLLAIAVILWLFSLPKANKAVIALLQITAALGLILIAGLPWFVQPYTMAFSANLLLILMIILLFIASFTYEDRRIFWASVLMAAILILSRTLEYETELLIKAVIFTACGVGIIVAGVMFERFLKARRTSNA
jgi:uncharacterized membrane protein